MPPVNRTPCRCRGVGLVEVLVALVVVSWAILGFLALQVQTLRQSGTAHLRVVAQQLAQDLAERMRANPDPQSGLAAYRFTTAQAAQAVQVDGRGPALQIDPLVSRCNQPTDTCDPAQLAAVDLFEWRTAVFARLPSGAAFVEPRDTVTEPSTANCGLRVAAARSCDAADIWIAWREPRPREAASGNGLRCPEGLAVAQDTAWRCHHLRIRL